MVCPHGQLNQDVPRNIHIEFCMISVILKPKRQKAHPGSLPFAGEARGPAAVQIPRMDVDVLPRAQKAPVLPKAQRLLVASCSSSESEIQSTPGGRI